MAKINIILGALILTTTAFFAGHASSKFAAAKAYYIPSTGGCAGIDNATPSGIFTTVGVNQATIRTSAGGSINLYSNSNCTVAVYAKPS